MGDTAIDMIGFRSGKLVAIAKVEGRSSKRAYWLCRCDCGNYRIVMGKYLRRHEVKSCGCLNRQPAAGPRVKHGHAHEGKITPTYTSWSGMLQRCLNPNNNKYFKYGAKGVRFPKRWLDFRNFLADMGERPPGTTLDRYPNPKGDYGPNNCRWATPKEQSYNSSCVRLITFKGKTLSLSDWAREIGMSTSSFFKRLRKMTVIEAITMPKRGTKKITEDS